VLSKSCTALAVAAAALAPVSVVAAAETATLTAALVAMAVAAVTAAAATAATATAATAVKAVAAATPPRVARLLHPPNYQQDDAPPQKAGTAREASALARLPPRRARAARS